MEHQSDKLADGYRGIIQDIKLPGDVGTFRKGDKLYSKIQYFNRVVYEGQDRKIRYPTLPLTEIKNGVWIPLENLVASHTQVLRFKGSGMCTETLREQATTIQSSFASRNLG